MGRFVLTKRKGAKRWSGVIPIRKGARLDRVRKSVSKNLRKGFVFRIVDKKQLGRVLLSMKPKSF